MSKETENTELSTGKALHIGSVRCSDCVFYDKRTKTTGSCNRFLKTFFHYKTGKWTKSLNVMVRSTWKCDDFVHYA